jgi:cell division transport system permease protein
MMAGWWIMRKQEAETTKKISVSGAKTNNKPNALNSYFSHHQKTYKATLKQLLEQPAASFFTCAVIGIAFVLPALLAILLNNIQSVQHNWDGSAQITLFLKKGVPVLEGELLSETITKKPSITSSHFVDNDTALEEFKERFELQEAVDFLDENPLPHVILVQPDKSLKSIEHIEQIKNSLLKFPEVEGALLDVMWVQRLNSITILLQRAAWIIALMLGSAVVLILGNTIRLFIENRKEEIAVVKLVGGTNAFVRRPFLYMGVFFGLGGSIIAWILINLTLYMLNGPIQELARSYQSTFNLSGFSFESTLLLIILGMALGWFGAWLSVRKHLDDIEPT